MLQPDEIVIIAPDRAGMVPPVPRNLPLCAAPTDVGRQPAILVAVSASDGDLSRATVDALLARHSHSLTPTTPGPYSHHDDWACPAS